MENIISVRECAKQRASAISVVPNYLSATLGVYLVVVVVKFCYKLMVLVMEHADT